ncbi:ArsR/SmtB family transcription factor [Streptomyces sp. NBC_01497]|uniref:ArsR/SmtB family transcription factor n=1 Tax=Streptomyces sp. NBC_01497 TaxID=2903885 RepID=UPI002E379EE4|nr:winged helix-turn-helix domain-containing protein [Streptomyces sp. NBC_01497]
MKPEQVPDSARLLDAHSLRGLAHPLRMRLLTTLRHDGPATASQLAGAMGESSGSTSYHLRQLAAHGFVEDAPGHGKGRERWWRAVDDGIAIDETLTTSRDPAVRAAVGVLVDATLANHAQEVADWSRSEWPDVWAGKADFSDFTLQLTPDLLDELAGQVHDLIDSYRDRASAPDKGPTEGAGPQRVRLHFHAFPQPAPEPDQH